MRAARTQTPQRVLLVTRRRRRPRALGTGRCILAAVTAFVLYRSVPRTPDADLAATVAQQLRFDYSKSRTAEMERLAARHEADALLAVSDDVLSARIEIDDIGARGPILPPPLPRSLVVRVEYRVLNGHRVLESKERCLEFHRGLWSDWGYRRDRDPLLCWPIPF